MSGAHAFLPPSGAGAWVVCAAWPLMNATFPQDDTDESREGTAAHWCWDGTLTYGTPLPLVGAVAPNGVIVTDEMLDGAEMYIGVIERDMFAAGRPREELFVEQRVQIPGVHVQNWGTPDSWFFDPVAWRLYVYDYKYGHGFVDAYENWQCIDYASGVIDYLADRLGMTSAELDQRISVRITVVQPRNYDPGGHVRTWDVQASDLRAYWNVLAGAAERAMQYPPVATPGREQCKHCPGRAACVVVQRGGYDAADLAKQVLPSPLSPEAAARELVILQDAQELLKARVSGLEAEIEARLKRGESVPGWGFKPTKGRERWTAPPEQVAAIGAAMGVKLEKPALITPNQARAAGIPAPLVASLSASSSGVELARVDQKALSRAFGKL